MKDCIMKKLIPAFLLCSIFLCGCSYLSKLNPWGGTEEEKVYEAPKVNEFLWRAALDKTKFMPLSVKDAKSGRIVTGWYQVAGQPAERFKLEIRVLSEKLRADCLKVSGTVEKTVNGKWSGEPMKRSMLNAIELSILERARVLYQQSLDND